MNKLPIYNCSVSDQDETGIYAMSFVDDPANMRKFVTLNKARKVKMHTDAKKQVLTGPILLPGQMIYRNDEYGEYYMTFSAEEIEKIAAKMVKSYSAIFTTTHNHNYKTVEGCQLVELWIVKDPKTDKSAALGIEGITAGTMMVSYKINNSDYWREEVMTGNVTGFSLEGFFNVNQINMATPKKAANKAAKKPASLSTRLAAVAKALFEATEEQAEELVEVAAEDTTDSGDPLLAFDLAGGGVLLVDNEGYATVDGEQAPAGEHELADGNFIEIDADGYFVTTEEEASTEEPSEAAVDLARQNAKAYLAKYGKASTVVSLKKRIAELEKKPAAAKKAALSKTVEPTGPTAGLAKILKAKQEARKR